MTDSTQVIAILSFGALAVLVTMALVAASRPKLKLQTSAERPLEPRLEIDPSQQYECSAETRSALAVAADSGDTSVVEAAMRFHDIPASFRSDAAQEAFKFLAFIVLEDLEITSTEVYQLERWRLALGLDVSTTQRLAAGIAQHLLTSDLKSSVADRRLTDADIEEVRARLRRIKHKLALDGNESTRFDRFEEMAMWELGRLPEVRSPVSLRPSEVCHLVADTTWLERKTVRTRVGYSGLAYTLPIARGLHYRIGNVSPTYNEDVSLVQVDTGKLIFTSQRVIFIGVQGTKSFAWSNVLSVTPWSDAVELARSSGKHPVFPLGDAESAVVIATSILSRT